MKKVLKYILNGIFILFVLMVILGNILPGDIVVKGEDGQTYDLSYFTTSYITDENYEPEERDLISHAVTVFHYLDQHKWKEVDNYFRSPFVYETALIEAYGVLETNPEKIEKFKYIVEDKQFVAYLNEQKVEPIEVDIKNGIEWAVFPYDTWLEFSFQLTRVLELENGEIKKDTFDVKGNYPPLWLPDRNETWWKLGTLMLRDSN